MLATVSSLWASPGGKEGRREAPVSLGMGRDASHRTQRCCGLARTLVRRGEPPPTPPAQGGGEDPKDTPPLGDPICHPPKGAAPSPCTPRGSQVGPSPGERAGVRHVHPRGEPTGRYGHGGDAAGTAPARLGCPRECHLPRMGTMALAPSLNPQGPSAGHRAHGGPGPAPVPGSARLEGDALRLSIPPGGATAWLEAGPPASPVGTCPRWG